jgi:hypothetical protein
VTGNLLKQYKNSLLRYISGESPELSAKRESENGSKSRNLNDKSSKAVVEDYNNFDEKRNSNSANSNYEMKSLSFIDNILNNRKLVIEILNDKGSNEDKQILLKKMFDESDTQIKSGADDIKSLKENRTTSAMIDHARSMGMGNESHDSLLCDDEAPNKSLKERMASHSFHKRPLSQNNVVRSKSSRQKKKKTPVIINLDNY